MEQGNITAMEERECANWKLEKRGIFPWVLFWKEDIFGYIPFISVKLRHFLFIYFQRFYLATRDVAARDYKTVEPVGYSSAIFFPQ